MNAGHVAPRFRKPFGYALLVRGGFVSFWVNVTCVTLFIKCEVKISYINKKYTHPLVAGSQNPGAT